MKITLYQIIPELDNDHLMFRELQFIQTASGNRVPAEIYEAVYQGELDIRTLEDAFYIFNMEHTEGYKGRSVSVSDVVEVFEPDAGYSFYFCSTIGFKRIAFDREKAMLPITNHDFRQEEIIRCGNFQIVFPGEFGVQTASCSKIVLTRCRYSQCQLGYKLQYWYFGEDRWLEKTFASRPILLFAHTGFHCIPESVFYEYPEPGMRKQRYGAFSDENYQAAESWCKENNIKCEYL